MAVSELVGSVRRAAGASQVDFAERIGHATSSLSLIESGRRVPLVTTCDRILRELGHGLAVVPTTRASVLEWAVTIRSALKRGDRQAANRAFLGFADVLQSESPTNRVILTACEPEPTGEAIFDAALAAVSEYFLVGAGAPIPDWALDSRRVVLVPQAVLAGPNYSTADVWLPDIPEPFLRRGALVEEPSLASA